MFTRYFLLESFVPFDKKQNDAWNSWKDDNDKQPVWHDDFEIYSNLEDALLGQNRWKAVSWHGQGMGFPGYSTPTDNEAVLEQQDGSSRCATGGGGFQEVRAL